MVAAENYALNNECTPNNEFLRISSYIPFRYMRQTRQRELERQGDVAHGNTRSRAQLGNRRTWPPRVYTENINFGLPASVKRFLFVSMWGMPVNSIYAVSVIKDARSWATYRESTTLP